MTAPVTIVGLGTGEPPTADAAAAIDGADLLIGGRRLLDLVADRAPDAERWDLTGRLRELPDTIARAARADRAVVVLASGDPMFYGVGGFLADKLRGRGLAPRILPAPTALSVAAARFGIKWSDAHVVSGHGRPIGDLPGLLRRHGKLAVYTDPTNSPAAIGQRLRQAGIVEGTAWVAEDLGGPDERCRRLPIADLADLTDVHPLNVLFLVTDPEPAATIPFDPDADFERKMPRKGLITKREVRVLSLAMLGVRPGDVCWDIGAGSGAISVDLARCGARAVWAVEKNADACEIIQRNVERFGLDQVHTVHARAPEGLDALPDPDRVFIGGSGGEVEALLEQGIARLRPGGALVFNAATVENLSHALSTLRRLGAPHDAIQVQIARSRPILGRLTRFEALNPVTILRASPPREQP
ncbi:MAG: precorrin-6y C5,15-methyltransferase (decarboxylating) subunit CbiE [Deltaproteobacteria bacterium]|nr:MAG: precorrin-6y C5,15-methyltransferase (decarboxylating) subunit CbiE [Deltaproteobacteria bacterium]